MRSDIIITIVAAVLGSSGLWAFLQFILQKFANKKENIVTKLEQQEKELQLVKAMSLGALYDRALYLGEKHIEHGEISISDYNDYKKYIYEPYHAAGGNGTVDRIMEAIDELPIHE